MKMPETCPICGNKSLRNQVGEFKSEFEGQDGISIPLIIPNLNWKHCDNCGEDILDHEATQVVSAAQRSALGLLTAEELKNLRGRLRKSQQQMSELLGIGKKTYCRWESGTHFQSEAFDRYLRLLDLVPSNVRMLESLKKQPASSHPHEFRYLRNPSVYESSGRQFLALLETGPFNDAA